MAKYSIKDVEHLTGIKAHTIRIWERRYNLIVPSRTDNQIRYYSDDELKMILNVSILNSHGIKISKIASKSEEEIKEMILHLVDHNEGIAFQIDQLTSSMVNLDERKFEKVINNSILKIGFEDTVTKIIYPFLDKIGILWQTGTINPAHEHFISNLVRQKLIVAIDGVIPANNQNPKTFFLFLPEGEFHEFGLLFYYYVIKKQGHQVFYLGQSTPFGDLEAISEFKSPDFLLTTFVSTMSGLNIEGYLKNLSNKFNKTKIILTGQVIQKSGIKIPENAIKIANNSEMYVLLK